MNGMDISVERYPEKEDGPRNGKLTKLHSNSEKVVPKATLEGPLINLH